MKKLFITLSLFVATVATAQTRNGSYQQVSYENWIPGGKAHPDMPIQDFSSIPQDIALAYIEYMAEIESKQ